MLLIFTVGCAGISCTRERQPAVGPSPGGPSGNAAAPVLKDDSVPLDNIGDLSSALARGNFNIEKAWDILNPELKKNPGDVSLLVLKARLLWTSGNLDESEKTLDFVLGKEPRNSAALALKAKLLLDRFGNEKGLETVNRLIAASPGKYENRLLKGRVLFQLCKYGEAEKIFRSLIHEHPERIEAYLWLSDLYDASVKPDEGLKFIKGALSKTWKASDRSRLLVELGEIYEKEGDTGEALKYFNEAVRLDPGNEIAASKVAICAPDFGVAAGTVDELKKTIGKGSDSAYPYFALARIYYNEGWVSSGKDLLNKSLKEFPLEMEGYGLLGYLTFESREYRESQKAYAHAKALHPGDYNTMMGIALLDIVRRDSDSAKKILSKLKPPSLVTGRHYCRLGDVYMNHMRDYDTADRYYRKSLEYKGRGADTVMTLAALGEIRLKKGMDSEGEEYFDRAIRDFPGDISVYFEIIPGSVLNKKYKIAEKYLGKMEGEKSGTKWTPGDLSAVYLRTAYAYLISGDLGGALKMSEKSMKYNPEGHPFGEVFLAKPEKRNEARAFYEKAVKLHPENALSWFFLGFLAEESGDKKNAESYYKKAGEGLASPGDMDYYKAWVYSIRRNREQAAAYLRKACEKDIFNAPRAYADESFDWMRDDRFFKDELPELLKQVKGKSPYPSKSELEW
ncbi:MAG: tetratricopeptide repeat protein [Chloroflexi bacterium]|nr:tetratricopeptide repeat protein [Chloroflexota bacterium]